MTSSPTTIAFSGYYGMSNFGDDLFGIAASIGAQRYWSPCSVLLAAPRIRGANARHVAPRWFPSRAYGSLGATGKLSRLLAGAVAHRMSGKFIYAGGSLFHGEGVSASSLLETVFCGSSEVSAIGVSLGPFKTVKAEKEARSRLARFEFLSLRDQSSYDIAKSFGLHCPIVLSADLAATLPLSSPDESARDERRDIGFSPCNLPADQERTQRFCDAFLESVLKANRSSPVRVTILCLNEHPAAGDAKWCRYVNEKLRIAHVRSEVHYYSRHGVLETCERISKLDVYFSSRLHGAVVSHLVGVPFYLHEYHQKCSEFLDGIGKAEGERASFSATTSAELGAILDRLLAKPLPAAAPDAMRARSLKSFSEAPWAVDRGLK